MVVDRKFSCNFLVMRLHLWRMKVQKHSLGTNSMETTSSSTLLLHDVNTLLHSSPNANRSAPKNIARPHQRNLETETPPNSPITPPFVRKSFPIADRT